MTEAILVTKIKLIQVEISRSTFFLQYFANLPYRIHGRQIQQDLKRITDNKSQYQPYWSPIPYKQLCDKNYLHSFKNNSIVFMFQGKRGKTGGEGPIGSRGQPVCIGIFSNE